jgi:flagellar motor switch protein FliN/FliY
LDPFTAPRRSSREDIAIMLDVPMVIEAEMGRSNKTVNDVLKLGEGSVIEFERDAGEPVDLLVNGTLIARGEVVEIEGNYGVRITEIMRPA